MERRTSGDQRRSRSQETDGSRRREAAARRKQNKAKMRKNIAIFASIAAVVGLVLGGVIGQISGSNATEKEWQVTVDELELSIASLEVDLQVANAAIEEALIEEEEDTEVEWYLRLVNYENFLTEDEALAIETANVSGTTYQVDARIVDAVDTMLADAYAEGVNIIVCSAFRTWDYQENLYNNSMSRYISSGYSYYEAYELAGQYVAKPGSSEHQLGLALDFVSPDYQILDDDQQYTDSAIWLKANAYNYGFILRYPEDKEDITQIGFEPWHYRYVGVEAATFITENNLTLEEYWEEYL